MMKHSWRAVAAAILGAAGCTALVTSTAGAVGGGPYPNGTVFVADQDCACVWEIPPGGGSPFIFVGANESPQSVAVDSAGDLFWTQLADGTVDERTAGGSTVVLASGFLPTGVAVDSAGDVYFGSFGEGSHPAGLYEIPSGGSATLVTSSFGEFESITVDGNGTVWGAAGSDSLVAVPPGTTGAGIDIAGSGFNGVALDRSNNLFASDAFGNGAFEVPAGSVSPTTLGSIGSYSRGATVDGSGNMFVGAPSTVYPDGKVYEIPAGGSPGTYASDIATTNGLAVYPPAAPAARSSSTVSLTSPNGINVTTRTTVTLHATVAGGATGGVQFDDNGSPIGTAAATVGGKASITTRLSAGSHAVTATYLGNGTHAPATSSALNFTSKAISSKTVLTFPGGTTVPGDQKLTVDAQVSGKGSVPTGSVTFYDGSKPEGTAPLGTSGQASIQFYATPGTSNVWAVYGGDSTFATSKSARTAVTTTTPYVPTLGTSVTYGAANAKNAVKATIKVTVRGVNGSPAPTGTVSANDGFACSALTQVGVTNSSSAACTHRLATGTSESVTVSFTPGDANYVSASTQVYVSNFSGG